MSVGVVSARSFYRCITYLARMDFKFAGRSNNYGNCKSWFMYGGIIIFFGIMVFFDWIMIHSRRNIDNFLHKSLNNYDIYYCKYGMIF